MNRPVAVVIGCHWRQRQSELAFATRSLAGAASRLGPVTLLVPGDPEWREADGLFDQRGMGAPGSPRWPDDVPTGTPIIVDERTADVEHLLTLTSGSPVFALTGTDNLSGATWRSLHLVGGEQPIGLHVPVNRLASEHRHHGFGFTDYVLVLSDRSGESGEQGAAPPAAAAWVSAAFTDADVVVVEDAVAWAWKARALRGKVPVDTRMDLWRLLAHAKVCIDLAPGSVVARECIEALRFGTPIIVPDRVGAASVHAHESGGGTFGDPDDLLRAVARLRDDVIRTATSDIGRRYADDQFGDPEALVARVRSLLHAA